MDPEIGWFYFREPVSAWTHLIWLLLSLPATWFLLRRSWGDRLKVIGLAIFGLTVALCFTGSWLYHSVPLHGVDFFAMLDHIGIYLLIAGTVTPIGMVVLRGWYRVGLLSSIWMLASVGITLRLTTEQSVLSLTGLYLFMGWVSCLAFFEIVCRLSWGAVRPIWIGGLLYSLGAIINGIKWPDPFPGVGFGAHELFHLFVISGSACHYYFMLAALLPYRR